MRGHQLKCISSALRSRGNPTSFTRGQETVMGISSDILDSWIEQELELLH